MPSASTSSAVAVPSAEQTRKLLEQLRGQAASGAMDKAVAAQLGAVLLKQLEEVSEGGGGGGGGKGGGGGGDDEGGKQSNSNNKRPISGTGVPPSPRHSDKKANTGGEEKMEVDDK